MRALAILGNCVKVVHTAEGVFNLGNGDTIVDAVIGIITRHPMHQEELERTLAQWAPEQIGVALAELKRSGRAQVVDRLGARFWSAAPARYPDEVRSQASVPQNRQHHR